MNFFKKIDPFTFVLLVIILLMYIYNLYINGVDAITGISGEQVVDAGGMGKNASIVSLVTSMFAHQSLPHLLVNVVMIYLLGKMVFESFGLVSYVTGFLISGIVGNVCMLVIIDNGTALGASGCVFGLLGMLNVGSQTKMKQFKSLINIKIYIQILTIVCLGYTVLNFNQGVNLYTHFLGILTGVVVSFVYLMVLKKKKDVMFNGKSKKY